MWKQAGGIASVLAIAALAGCIGGEDPGVSQTSENPVEDTGNAANEAAEDVAEPTYRAMSLYSFNEDIIGASPPNPEGEGAAAEALPIAATDSFTVPAGTTRLAFEGGLPLGSGVGRIEIVDPAGNLVFQSKTWILAGAPGLAGAGITSGEDVLAEAPVAPGTYTVNYYVAGAMTAILEVTGTILVEAQNEQAGSN